MRPVEYTRENVDKCWCGSCPVQIKSECAKERYEKASAAEPALPEDRTMLAGMYCCTGKTVCDDIVPTNLCLCAQCLVWSEHELLSNHYCLSGSAEEVGR